MVPPRLFTDNIDLVRSWKDISGDLVECGSWRGGMSGAMAFTAPGHRSVLFDSFEGLPDARPIDGAEANHWSREIRDFNNCTADEASAYEAMRRSRSTTYDIVKGWFDDTVPAWASDRRPIAILRLDGDWYDSTMTCLVNLFPLVVPSGGVIIDDYYRWLGCARAVHDYLSRTEAPERIQSTRYGVAYIRKLAR